MNSKERVRTVIAGGIPDRVPLGHYIIDCDIAGKILGRKTYFRDKIGSRLALWDGRRDELVESLKADAVDLFRKLDCIDIISHKDAPLVPPKGYRPDPPRKIADDLWETQGGAVYKAAYLTNDIACIRNPEEEAFKDYTPEDFTGDIEQKPPDPSRFEVYDYVIDRLRSDFYVAGLSAGYEGLVFLDGMQNGMMHFALHPEAVRAATERLTRHASAMDSHFIREGDDAVFFEQDQATSTGPMISPDTYRDIALPATRSRIANVKRFGKQVILHNCGDNRLHIPMLIDAGLDCYQSLQTGCMDLSELKDRFGKSLTFWGGVAIEHLVSGTAEEVRSDVRHAIEVGARGGRFILGPSHSIAYGTKYDNFMAMLDEYDKRKDAYR